MDGSALVVPIGGDAGYVAEGVEDAAWGWGTKGTGRGSEDEQASEAGTLGRWGNGGKDRSRSGKTKKTTNDKE
jgi:hypothetical protein